MTRPLLDAWTVFESGDDSVTLLDLARLAHQAASSLDNSVHGIPIVLDRASVDLEYAFHASKRSLHRSEGRRILEPVIASFAQDLQGQTFCDWCYGPLSAASVASSRAIGLAAEYAFACDRCIERGAFWEPPDDLEEGAVWPVERLVPPGTDQA